MRPPAYAIGGRQRWRLIESTSGTEVKTSKQRRGGVDVHTVIVQEVGNAIAKGHLDPPMQVRFGQPVKPIPR
jgi:hypothetical protein